MASGFTLRDQPLADRRRLILAGALDIAHIDQAAQHLALILPEGLPLEIDLHQITRIDSSGAWLIFRLIRDWQAAGLRADYIGLSPQQRALIARAGEGVESLPLPAAARNPVRARVESMGRALTLAAESFGGFLGFLGQALIAFGKSLREPRRFRIAALLRQMELTAVNALGIVGMMSFLVGIVIAQQGAVQLKQFGADVYVINLVGRLTLRELGVLMTAIMVAGRSGSAFAAQIGAMKLAEEIDAMRTIGLPPVEILVLPRVLALALMMPLLSFYGAMLSIIGGGILCWTTLGIPPITFIQRLQEVVPMHDLWVGLIKAPIFGIIIAVTGCYQGMQVRGNAEDVGLRTTAAVVQSIFMVIVLDAFFAVFFSTLGWI